MAKSEFRTVFRLTNNHIILATPVILFSLISAIYLITTARGSALSLLLAFVMYILMVSAFLAGWFNMVKKVASNNNPDEILPLVGEFPEGVGKYFLSSLAAVGIIIFVTSLMSGVVFLLGMKFIGNPNVSMPALIHSSASAEAVKTFLSSLTADQIRQLRDWNRLLLLSSAVIYFTLIYYFPALFFKSANPIKAYFISLRDLFSRKIFKTILLFVLLMIIYFVVSLFSAISVKSSVLHFIATLVYFYYLTLAVVGVFYFYYRNFVTGCLGQNIDTTV